MSVPEEALDVPEDLIDGSPDAFIPFEARRPERVIPVRSADLQRRLLADRRLGPSEQAAWHNFARLLYATFHHEFLAWHQGLKDLYAPLDPDSDCVNIGTGTRLRDESSDEAFLRPFEAALVRANFQSLHLSSVREAVEAPNELGLNYEPDFEMFEHLKVYVRGQTKVHRTVRGVKTGFRRKTVTLEAFHRLIVALKFRPAKKLGPFVRDDVLYIRLFKDVPFVDMEMHLPEQGTRVKMRGIDKAKIASPLLVGLPTFALKLLTTALISPIAVGGILVAPVTAGLNSFFGFQRAKQKHLHHMIRSLYYLTLANNASVLSWVVDAAEEEEFKEALLAYFLLWQGRHDATPWDHHRLDAEAERFLREITGLSIDFEVGDALNKLIRLGLVQLDAGGALRPIPPAEALAHLDAQWDNLYRFAPNSSAANRDDLIDNCLTNAIESSRRRE
jgi:hypothetical protein